MISVAVGVGLAAAYVASGYWVQVRITKSASKAAPALMIVGMLVRLALLAVVVVPIALYTDLNLLALLVAFAVAFTLLQAGVMTLQVKKANAAKKDSDGV